MTNVQTLKGFRDFLPKDAGKRDFVLSTLKKVFALYGFEPLETPSLEYEDILTGKYGDAGEKLMYKFIDNGDRKVALRYDQTVPLARVVAQYQNELPLPFKRYQIQNVWRAENTQKGRYREFLQVDADIVGVYSPLADAECIVVAVKCLQALGFEKFNILINDRKVFNKLVDENVILDSQMPTVVRAIDKLKKIGKDGVLKELSEQGFEEEKAKEIINKIQAQEKTDTLEDISIFFEGISLDKEIFKFDPTLARGLDYYTGIIFEVEVQGYDAGSIAGGGRYDNLIGMFAGRDIPAVGFSFGFDRLMEAMEALNLFPKNLNANDVFVAFSNPDLQKKALEITNKLRAEKINSECYLEDATLEKQLKYADKKQIPYVLIVGEDNLALKDMSKRTQEENLTIEEIIRKLK